MSANLYTRCIFWSERGGRARHDGVEVALHRSPFIGKLQPRMIEFAPEVHLFRIAETAADSPRDMTPAEISDTEWLLVKMAAAVRECIG